MKTERQFPVSPTAVTMSRRFVTSVLNDLPPARRELAELMVSELATNAIVHAASEFTVSVERLGDAVKVAVSDQDSVIPQPRLPIDQEPHGRGLHIIDELSDSWGAEPNPEGGKTIWFVLDTARSAGSIAHMAQEAQEAPAGGDTTPDRRTSKVRGQPRRGPQRPQARYCRSSPRRVGEDNFGGQARSERPARAVPSRWLMAQRSQRLR